MSQNPADGETTLERVRRLSEAVRRSDAAHRDTLRARDAALRQAFAAGHHEADLAQAAGLTRQRIIGVVCLPDPAPEPAGAPE